MVHRHVILGVVAVAILGLDPARAQAADESGTAVAPTTDVEAMVLAARKLLADRYVLPDVAAKLDEALARAASSGTFQGLSGEALAARVNSVMSQVTADVHLQIRYQPALSALLASAPGESTPNSSEWDKALARQLQRTNAGVRKLEMLPGNIRYLAYDSFGWGAPVAQQAIATAMEFLRHGDAIIIDLRNNAGGSTYAEAAIASYFLPPHTKLNRFEMRGMLGETTETTAAPFSLAGKPTFVLIGPATVSGAEWFATHASTFGFGTLVGATTRGGGYTIRTFPLPGDYVLSVSVGRALDALTNFDLEGIGVEPAIAVSPDKALVAAQATAMERLLAGMSDAESAQGERLLAFYRAQVTSTASALPLENYVGRYGEFTVETQHGDLMIRFQDFSPDVLMPVAPNIFAPASEPSTQIRFAFDGSAVVALELDSGNGPPARIARTIAVGPLTSQVLPFSK